ncbi:hypothetical protein FOZ60_015927 [Perkinsus olseni]|uniref:Uncharacterized protein n=2 Tax=Perkinsus olseni TaxID=32597 RepID=A0A7J6P555_PEROL|nr:hypothetical protein FOZ60_015927 [Perkinsus olseni]
MRAFGIGLFVVLPQQALGSSLRKKGSLKADSKQEGRCILSTKDVKGKGKYDRPYGENETVTFTPHGASVGAIYDQESNSYFVDYTSIELTAKNEGSTQQRVHHFISPGEPGFENMQNFTLGDSRDCRDSIVEGARRVLKEGRAPNGITSKLAKEFTKNSKSLSPLIISRFIEESIMPEPTDDESEPTDDEDEPTDDEDELADDEDRKWHIADNGNIYTEVQPVSMFSVFWSDELNYAYMNSVIFVDSEAKKPFQLPLSPQGLDLVRSAFKKVTYGKREMFQKKFEETVLEVSKELMENPDAKRMAGDKDWDAVMKKAAEGGELFTETLVLAVATGWNKKMKSFISLTENELDC